MAVPEQHDEPPRLQPGPPAARSRCPRLTILGHNQSVNFWGDPKLGPKATTYQAQWPGKPTPRSCADDALFCGDPRSMPQISWRTTVAHRSPVHCRLHQRRTQNVIYVPLQC
jgi:hypothetical protein